MKATIDVRESRGIFSTSWTVECQLQFTEVEHAAIRQGKLDSKTVHYVGSGENERAVTLGEIRAGTKRTFSTLLAASESRRFIEETSLPIIKSWLVTVENFGTGSKTIEL